MPVGQLRFLVPDPSRLTERAVPQAYLTGLDPIPSFCRARVGDGGLIVEREGFESVKLNVPWRVDGRGELLVTTATLAQRDRPYLLPLELARGKINQVRNQLAEWLPLGLVPSDDVNNKILAATRQFTQAAVGQADAPAAAAQAEVALAAACDAADALSACYVEQALAVRHRTSARLPIAYGVSLGLRVPESVAAQALTALCNTAVVPMVWRDVVTLEEEYRWDPYVGQVEWCRGNGLNVAAGPLVRLDDRGLPDWLMLWQADVDGVLAFTAEYVTSVVRKFRGAVTMWHVASYSHRNHSLGLRDEDKLRIIVRALETARRHDPDAPLIVSFDQPWGEYLRRVPMGYSPLHVADHLVRLGLPLAALGLELEIGYQPDGTYHRDALELGRIIDLWASLGLPLFLYLTIPGGDGPDPQAKSRSKPQDGVYGAAWNAEAQARWIREFVPMLLARSAVQGIAWNVLRDDDPHDLPHAGLFDARGNAKPAYAALVQLRKEHLL
jgi:GH35 family endo-1,4-beta-xylanase